MPTDEIYARLAAIMQDIFEDPGLVPTPEMTAHDVDNWDSMSHIRLVMAVEQAFGVRFATAEIARMEKVSDLATAIQGKCG